MGEQRSKNWLPLAVLGAALMVWALLLALGTYLQLGSQGAHRDYRMPLIVVGTMTGFLLLWGFALWQRSRRK